jgi:type II secretory pathway component PulC
MKSGIRTLFLLLLATSVVMAWLINSALNNNNAMPPHSAVPPESSTTVAPQSAISPETSTVVHVSDSAQKIQIAPPKMALYGTFIHGNTRMALVSIENNPQHWLNIKQYVNSDFYLDEILKDYVVIRDTEKTIALEIRITTNSPDAGEILPETPIPALQAHANVETYPPVAGIDRLESNHYRIKRELIIKELQSGEVFKQVKITPEEKGGFFIERIKDGSMAEIIGLRVGDSIHKINSKPLTNITDVLELYKNLDHLEKVEVEITRMNQTQQLYYEIQ